jgi:hypothetical protein
MKRLVIASAALALSAAAAPAAAATIIVTVEGTLSYGSDDYNTLGLGTDLAGLPVSMVFTFDDQTPGTYFDNTSATGQYLWGYGPDYGAGYDSSPGSVVVSINGIERLVEGDDDSRYDTAYIDSDPTSWDGVQAYANDGRYIYDGDGNAIDYLTASASVGVSGLDMLTSASLYQTLDLQPGNGLSFSGVFFFYSWDYENWTPDEYIYGNLDTDSMTVKVATLSAPVSAVPEPATWALTILGFGLVAGAMRRQRRRIAVGFA